MVGPLKYFRKPVKRSTQGPTKSQWKGPGWYYHRGNGVWSKYSALRDMKHSTHRKVVLKGGVAVVYKKNHKKGVVGSGPYRHTTDSTTRSKRKRKKTARKKKKKK